MTKRNYDKEYQDFQGTDEQKKRRAQRNQARREAIRDGKVKKGDNLEVDHIAKNRRGKLDNSKVKVVPKKVNRSKQPKRDGSED